MNIPAPPQNVAVRDVLPALGFEANWRTYSETPPGFTFNRSNLELTAGEMTNIYLRPGMHFYGLWRTARSLKMVDFEMPLKVESHEQAVAWITFGIGIDYVPSSWIGWFDSGKKWQDTLPWEKHHRELKARIEANRRLRAVRPHCFLSRKWLRMLLNHLVATMDISLPENDFRIQFDGRMLKLELADEMVGAPASGPDAWPCQYRVTVTPRRALPRRLRSDPVEVGIWDGMLEIEDYRFRVAEA